MIVDLSCLPDFEFFNQALILWNAAQLRFTKWRLNGNGFVMKENRQIAPDRILPSFNAKELDVFLVSRSLEEK